MNIRDLTAHSMTYDEVVFAFENESVTLGFAPQSLIDQLTKNINDVDDIVQYQYDCAKSDLIDEFEALS